jgi:hypothetical protein
VPETKKKASGSSLMSKKVAGIPVPILAVVAGVGGYLLYKHYKGTSTSSTTATGTTPATTDTGAGTDTGTGYTGGGGGGYTAGSGGGQLATTLAAIQAELQALTTTASTQTLGPQSVALTQNQPVTKPVPVSKKPTAKVAALPPSPVKSAVAGTASIVSPEGPSGITSIANPGPVKVLSPPVATTAGAKTAATKTTAAGAKGTGVQGSGQKNFGL